MTTIIGPFVYGTDNQDSWGSPTGAVVGNEASNIVYAYSGNDDVYGQGGNDTVYGGGGNDSISGGTGDDTLYGDGNDDVMGGDSGTNTLYGGSGNDYMKGTGGNDHFFGGSGFDTVDYSGTGIGAYIDVANHIGQGGDQIDSIERFIGSTSTDTMKGDASSNQFYGGNGADLLYGGDGVDTLDGGNGNDLLDGGNGIDHIYGGNGVDTVSYVHSSQGEEVHLYDYASYDSDQVAGVENIVGSNYADVFFGGWGANQIDGGAGNDWISGGALADSLIGGSGVDTIDYTNSYAGVSVDIQNNWASGGDAQGDKISGFERIYGSAYVDDLYGNAGDNWLWGDKGGDYLDGRAGNDTLRGGDGKDFMNGGTGADHFTYLNTTESAPGDANRDYIKDFSHAEGDKIDMASIDAKMGSSGDQAFTFINHSSFSGEGQIRSYFQGSDTILEFNTQGSGGAEMEIQLAGHINFTSGDFVL